MIIYNLTVNVTHDIHEEWIEWVKNVTMPYIMSLNIFNEFKIFRLLDIDETDGPTFALQMQTESLDLLKKYIREFAPEIRKDAEKKWGNNIYYYRTTLQSVQ